MDEGTKNTKMQRATQGFRSWICFRPQIKFWEGMCWTGPNTCSCSYSDGQPGFFFGLTGPVGCLHLVIRGHRHCFRCAVFTFCMFGSPDGGQSPQGLHWKSSKQESHNVQWTGTHVSGSGKTGKWNRLWQQAACLSCAVHLPIRTDPLGTGEIQLAQGTTAVAERGVYLHSYCTLAPP